MQKAHIIHNPSAGDKDITKEKLIQMVEAAGYKCGYSSTKSEKKIKVEEDVDFLIVSGGDGTVRRVAKELLEGDLKERGLPIAILPQGVANNIATMLGISGDAEEIIRSWHTAAIKKYDTGQIKSIPGINFFMESIGFGLLTQLMKKMGEVDNQASLASEERLQAAYRMLESIIPEYKAHECEVKINRDSFTGKFLMVEIMNTALAGPNLTLAPQADVSDGLLDVIMIGEKQRDELASCVANQMNGVQKWNSFQKLTAKKVKITWHGKSVHADDEEIKLEEETELKIEVSEGVLQFLVK